MANHRPAMIASCCLLMLMSTQAQAQSKCRGGGNDAFNTVRRARMALEDYTIVNREFEKDLKLMNMATEVHQIKDPPRFRIYGGPMADVVMFPLMPSCTTTGVYPADLQQTRLGILVGIDELKWGLSLRYIYSDYGSKLDGILPSNMPTDQMESPEQRDARRFSASTGQTTQALRLQLTPWFALALGQITYQPVSVGKGADDGTKLTDIEQVENDSTHDFVRVEIPIADLSLDFVFGESRQAVETLYIDLKNLPLMVVPMTASIKTAYLSDENQTYTMIGFDWINPLPTQKTYYEHKLVNPSTNHNQQTTPQAKKEQKFAKELSEQPVSRAINISQTTHRVGMDVATEFNSINLRYVRLRTDLNYRAFERKLNKLENIFIGQPYVSVELNWEASVFNSRFMQEQTGKRYVLGTGGGLSMGLGVRFMAIYLDTRVGYNRPEVLNRMVQAVDTPEAAINLRWRVGF